MAPVPCLVLPSPRARAARVFGLLILLSGCLPPALMAQEEEELASLAQERWVFQAELTSVLSQGNAESFTLGLGAVARRSWERDALRFEASAIRTESSRIRRRAVGTPDDFAVRTESDSELTAEAYALRARYDRTLSSRFFLFSGVDWLRNTFAGIDSRLLVAVGAGNTWIDRETVRFKTGYAVTYTFEQDVVESPFTDRDFPGARLDWEYWNQIAETTEFESILSVDLNLDDTEDLRYDLTNALTVEINDVLALKPSLQLQWRNQPAPTEVPLFTSGGVETGETVITELEKLDTFFRLALVLTL